MIKSQLIAALLLSFVLVSFVLSGFGFVTLSISDIISYCLIILGLSLVYTAFTGNNKILVFIGTVLFLFGLILFLQYNFEISKSENFLLQQGLIIGGVGIFMSYLIDLKKKLLLIIALIPVTAGLTLLIFETTFSVSSFIDAIGSVLKSSWPIVVILIIIIIIFNRERNQK